jgi:hypothetical protein
VIPHLWDEASLVKLVSAVLMRVSERWGKKQYSEFEHHQMRALRHALDSTNNPRGHPWSRWRLNPEEVPRPLGNFYRKKRT